MTITNGTDRPVATPASVTPLAIDEDTATDITLTYTDADGDKATECELQNTVKLTASCSCDAAGICTASVMSEPDYPDLTSPSGLNEQTGPASFKYRVKANGQFSDWAKVNLTVNAVDDAPEAGDLTSPASPFAENETEPFSFKYEDKDTANPFNVRCIISDLLNMEKPTSHFCTCNKTYKTCTFNIIGIDGGSLSDNKNGSLKYQVLTKPSLALPEMASDKTSATFTITGVNDPPEGASIAITKDTSSTNITEETEHRIGIAFTDEEGDKAKTGTAGCQVTNPNPTKVTITEACKCPDDGSSPCTLKIKGAKDVFGNVDLDYQITTQDGKPLPVSRSPSRLKTSTTLLRAKTSSPPR